MLEIIINNQSQICDSVAHDNHVTKEKLGVVNTSAQQVTATVCPALTALISFKKLKIKPEMKLWFLMWHENENSISYILNKTVRNVLAVFKL